MITIVDYGMGNLGSIRNMLRHIGHESIITSDLKTIAGATKLILPGVGSFDSAMKIINEQGFRKVLDKKAKDGTPILGICLGMQLLTNGSEEGKLPGLGWIDAETKRFQNGKLKVPHMGWNLVTPLRKSKLARALPEEPRFYFVHSYYVVVKKQTNSILKTTYGITFDSAIQHKNIYGVQFHPEKSHRYGMKLLENFARL